MKNIFRKWLQRWHCKNPNPDQACIECEWYEICMVLSERK